MSEFGKYIGLLLGLRQQERGPLSIVCIPLSQTIKERIVLVVVVELGAAWRAQLWQQRSATSAL